MGMKFGDIFKKDEETLVIDRNKEAIKWLIVFTLVVMFVLIIMIVLKNVGDLNEVRRKNITKDIQNIKNYVMNKSTEIKENPDVVIPGTSLEDSPYSMTINGIQEEYRYGYYILMSQDIKDMSTALNLPDEQYIVNYDTYDVINIIGVKYKKGRYHSLDDILAIEYGQNIPSQNTIIIKLPADMQKLQQYPNANFKLAGNIDMSMYAAGEGWNPVESFNGKLDGRGYIISNLTIERPSESHVGLFGQITSGAVVTNLTLQDVHVTGEDYTGALAGVTAGTVSHVYVQSGDVKGEEKVGGLVGAHQQGSISNCKVNIKSVAGRRLVGGFVGELSSGTIKEAMSIANINALESVGGFVGSISATNVTYLSECAARATVAGTDELGGLIGKVEILSTSKLQLINCYSNGTISEGETNMGGIIGYVRTSAGSAISFEDIYTSVNILQKNATSGACIGVSNISIASQCSVSDVFWEKNLAVGEVLYGVGSTIDETIKVDFTDKSPDEMKYRTTFANWDFDIWKIDERIDTPRLKMENGFKDIKK